MEAPSLPAQRASFEPPKIPGPRGQTWVRAISRFVLFRYFRCEYAGVERIPQAGRLVVISNHPSYLDPFAIGWGFRERWVTWMAWQDAFGWPVVGDLITRMGAFPVDPERPKPSTFKQAFAVLKAERPLGIFFEGKRSSGVGLDDPFPGAARIALQTNAPVMPVSVAGMRRLWDPEGLPKPGKVRVTYHPVIDPREVGRGQDRASRERLLTERVASVIASALPPDGRHRFPDD
ncbi:MAG: 1-acyl-sn-glycerol-3-phosphate acyltransferase, partial [Planctomycetes bacterium]|nr:1-acyl-sn-glycerol-3-phosphate acyltransferase [Planctomycetota bacterium]